MVARGECVAQRSTLPLDHPAKQGSPERAADTRVVNARGVVNARRWLIDAPAFLITANYRGSEVGVEERRHTVR
jgi:hypothetical protein